MPDHTAQELRGAALEHTGKLLAMMSRLKSRPLHPEEQEILDSAKQLRRLAAGPTREERLIDACACYHIEGEADQIAAELIAVIRHAHARKLAEEDKNHAE